MAKSLLQLTPYALVELDYETTQISTNTQSFLFFNSSYTNERQILNVTKGNNPTSNILDRSAVRLTDTRTWAHLDQDRAIPYNIYDANNLSQELLTDLTSTQWPVEYETVRLHLLSGYNLEDLDGLLLSIEYPEVSGKNCTIAQIAYLKGDEYIKFNARPIIIAGRSYDRYIEVLIPSLFSLNEEFYANPTSGSLAYWLSSDNKGFLKNGLISITLREISTSSDNGTVLSLTTGEITNVTYKQQDAFSLLTAVIIENDEEDCFEYYPSWQGGFVEDLVSSLNGVGGDYYVFHELYIYEQLGFSQVPTDYFVSIQEGDFNGPKRFRPVLKNADSAYSFSIDYVMRLTDKDTGSQIVRLASVTSLEPKRYGRKIEKVNLEGSVRSYKIYNKIIEENKLQVNKKTVERKVEKLFTPTFFDFNEVAVNTSNVILKTDGTFTTESVWNWDVIFGQGEAIMLLHPYENYVKFKMHRYLENNVTTSLDLRYDVDLFLVVEYAGKRVKFSKLEGFYSTNLAEGEIVFKIPAKEASSIYANEGGIFYITSKVPSFIKVKVMDNFVGGIANKEINIISKEYYSKGDTDLFELIFDGTTYFVPKNMLQVIQIIPTGSGVSETTLYTGKWRRMQEADTVKDEIEKIRRNELERVLNNIRTSQLSLNTRQSELSQRAAELAALEARLNAQSASQSAQSDLLNSLKRDVSSKEKVLNQRELDLREQARKAAELENQNIAAFQDQLNKILKSIEDLEIPSGTDANTGGGTGNQGTGNQGTGNQGTGNQGTGNQGTGNQGTGNQGTGNQGTGNQGTGNQGTGNQGTGNQGTGTQGTRVRASDILNRNVGINNNTNNVNITNVASRINYVDFAGRSGNDLGVLPSTGFNPITIDAGLDTSKKGFQLAGSGSTVGTNTNSNVNATVNSLIGGTTNTASRNNNFTDPQYNLTPIARERNRNVRNNTGSNSGTGNNPPSGNTDKIVYGKVIDWDSQVRNELTFKNLSNGTTESFYKFTPFTYDGFKRNNRRVIVQVDTIQYLAVGNIIYSELTEKGRSILRGSNDTFDIRYVKIEIKNLIAPNLVEGVYLRTETGGIGSDPFLEIKTNPYEQRHKWDIIKKANQGIIGGGGGSGTRIPL
jgi:hypothetical protein